MFCPKCGNHLIWHNGELFCDKGGTGLSPMVTRWLHQAIVTTPHLPVVATNLKEITHDAWYCPRCASPMSSREREPDAIGAETLERICGHCGFIIPGRIIYQLVELHPHKSNDGGWC